MSYEQVRLLSLRFEDHGERAQLSIRKQFTVDFEGSLDHPILLKRREADIRVSCNPMVRQMT